MPNKGDIKNANWDIPAAELNFDMSTIATVAGFISAAQTYALKNAESVLGKLVGGPVSIILFTASVVNAVFNGLAAKTGNTDIRLVCEMKYTTWEKHQGGGVIVLEGWAFQRFVSCNWYK